MVSYDTIKRRPSWRELDGKLRTARARAAAGDWAPAAPEKLQPQFAALGLYSVQERTEGIVAALEEIGPSDYVGSYPPERSYEAGVRGRELYPFRWSSGRFHRLMYMKFVHTQDRIYVISLHEARW